MAKPTATHYEHIEGMSEEFQSFMRDAELDADGDENDGADHYRYWHLRINLAIAQQLSVISQTLKEIKEARA